MMCKQDGIVRQTDLDEIEFDALREEIQKTNRVEIDKALRKLIQASISLEYNRNRVTSAKLKTAYGDFWAVIAGTGAI